MIYSAMDMMAPRPKIPVSEEVMTSRFPEQTNNEERKDEENSGVVVEISEDLKRMYQEQLESAKEAAEAAGEGMEEMAKVLEIARRISRGDHVPPGDEKKLMEYDKDLYQMAKTSATLYANRKHKKYKTLFEEEDKTQEEKIRELHREENSKSGTSSGEGTAESDISESL